MPRQGRINVAGGIYHIIQRGLERRDIFRDDNDRKEFLRRLAEGLEDTGHLCYGWALMPNHFHLLVRTSNRPLCDLMRQLLTGYALVFNKKYKRSGYLFQGRYKSILCQKDSYLLELVRYIHLNPLRANIVKDMNALKEYPWCGHSVIMGKTKADWQNKDEILGYFGKRKSGAIKEYEKFVAEAKDKGRRDDLTGGGLLRSAGGWKGVLDLKMSKEFWAADERILGDGDFVSAVLTQADEEFDRKARLKKEGWNIGRLIKRACRLTGADERDIRHESRRSKLAQARSLVAYWGNKELGISGVELAEYFGITKSSISSAIKRGRRFANQNEYRII